MRKIVGAMTLAAVTLPVVSAYADPPQATFANADYRHDHHRWRHHHHHRRYEGRRLTRHDRIWRGRDGRYYCRRSNGTTGLIVGGAIGALVGRSLDDDGDRSTGTILGLAGGALLGRAIDRGELRCR